MQVLASSFVSITGNIHADYGTDMSSKSNINTVDGRNPAPPGMYETLYIMGYLPYQLVSRISAINSIIQIIEIFMIGNVVLNLTFEVGSHAKEPAENAARNQAFA